MNAIILEAATSVQNTSITDWIKNGKKVVGYTCSFVPVEIFHAGGILPVRMRGIDTSSLEIGDTYFGPFICTFPKCILQLVGRGYYSFLDGAVITPGCDSMRRLDECWRKAGDDHKGIVPSFFFHYGVPHKVTSYSLKWFTDETQRLIAAVNDHFKVNITDDTLSGAIREYNEGRRLLLTLEEFRKKNGVKISGTDTFAAAVAGTTLPRNRYNALLKEEITELENRKDVMPEKRRLMVVGSVSDDISFIKLIEEAGCVVVAENLCFGVRHEMNEVDENGDPVSALARRYLSRSICPRMFGGYKERLSIIKEKIEKAGVDGVILQNVRFCDLHGSENGLFERDLEASGVPCLRLEREYGPMVERERIKMRLDAFWERIS